MSSPFDFLFPFDDFEVGGVDRAEAGADFIGLLSAGSSLGTSFCFGASTGERPISSSWTNQKKEAYEWAKQKWKRNWVDDGFLNG